MGFNLKSNYFFEDDIAKCIKAPNAAPIIQAYPPPPPNILFMGLDDFFANLGGGGGYAWIIGASLGAVIHLAISSKK